MPRRKQPNPQRRVLHQRQFGSRAWTRTEAALKTPFATGPAEPIPQRAMHPRQLATCAICNKLTHTHVVPAMPNCSNHAVCADCLLCVWCDKQPESTVPAFVTTSQELVCKECAETQVESITKCSGCQHTCSIDEEMEHCNGCAKVRCEECRTQGINWDGDEIMCFCERVG